MRKKGKSGFPERLRSMSVKARLSLIFGMTVALLVLTGAIFLNILFTDYESLMALEMSHAAAKVMEHVDNNLSSLAGLTKYPVVQTDQRPNNTYLYLLTPSQHSRRILDTDLAHRSTFLFSQNQNIRLIAVFDLNGSGSYVRNDKVATYKVFQPEIPLLEDRLTGSPWYTQTLQARGAALVWTYDELELPNFHLEHPEHLLFVSRSINRLTNFTPMGVILAAADISNSTQVFEESRKYPQQKIGVFDANGRVFGGNIPPESIAAFLAQRQVSGDSGTRGSRLSVRDGNMLFQVAQGQNGLLTLILTPSWLVKATVLKQELWIFIFMPLVIVMLSMAIQAVVRSITVPVNQLAETCRSIMQHEDFSLDINDRSNDEVAALGRALDALTGRIQFLIHDVYEKNIALGQTQIQLLRSQMNPHLLYNTLDTIRGRALMANQPDLAEMSLMLADILRYGISMPGELVTIAEEVEKLEIYLKLQKYLYQDRFHETLRINPSLMQRRTIKFILQPLVENAIQHGFSKMSTPGILEILGYEEDGDVVFQVVDHGKGMSKQELDRVVAHLETSQGESEQLGLRNVHRRLRLLFGDKYGVTVRSQPNVGTVVLARLPRINDVTEGGDPCTAS